jgi:GNAT superfamily N-acetyltransferase
MPDITLHTGYLPGIIGRVAELHGTYYHRTVNFGQFFEAKVATGLAEFTARLDRPCNRLWSAVEATEAGPRIVASVAIDGEDLGNNLAHLRWFIVDDSIQGRGIGKQLLQQAMAFCDEQAFHETHLWTFRGLDAARRLYEASGFTLAEEWTGTQWGREMVEQRFIRPGKPMLESHER